jgi:hypothetical protein
MRTKRNAYMILLENLKERGHLEDAGIYGWIILRKLMGVGGLD